MKYILIIAGSFIALALGALLQCALSSESIPLLCITVLGALSFVTINVSLVIRGKE